MCNALRELMKYELAKAWYKGYCEGFLEGYLESLREIDPEGKHEEELELITNRMKSLSLDEILDAFQRREKHFTAPNYRD